MIELNIKKSIQKNIPGWNGKVLVDKISWSGEKNGTQVHRQSRYLSNDPSVIANQCDLAQAAGFDGWRLTVQGVTVNPFLHDATIKLWEACLERQMLFCLLLDPWIAKQQPNPTQAVIDSLQSVDYQRIFDSPIYLPERYICEFDLANSAGVNIVNVQLACPTTPIISWHSGYTWPNVSNNSANPVDSLAILKSDSAKSTMKMCSANPCFNDGGQPIPANISAKDFKGLRDYSLSVWPGNGPTRVIDSQGGNWFFDQLGVIPPTIPYICIPTWDDYDEGTNIEHILAMLGGVRLISK
jgi:hypothetical protein